MFGVVKLHPSIDGAQGVPPGSVLVRAIEDVRAGQVGRFVKVNV